MLLQSWSSLRPPPPHVPPCSSLKKSTRLRSHRTTRRTTVSKPFCSLNIPNAELAEILHNKVLMAATISAAIGQLSKPFTSSIFHRSGLDFRRAFQAGGFPSSHSSAIVATATALGFERGLSDSVFGLAVVYAGLVMYDAQGVRREVGTHAKAFNKVLVQEKLKRDTDGVRDSLMINSSDSGFLDGNSVGKLGSFQSEQQSRSVLVESAAPRTDFERKLEGSSFELSPLKESVGHTEIEVMAGALLGLFVSLAVCLS